MKKITLALLCVSFTYTVQSQNTFPSTGKVGIGTTSPNAFLELISTGAHYSYLPSFAIKDASNRGTMILESLTNRPTDFVMKNNGRYSWSISSRDASSGYSLQFYPSVNGTSWSSPTLSLNTNGNTGIGTNSPLAKLHVEGNFLLDAYNQGSENGIFFREGFSASNKYNLSIMTYNDGDNSPDALSINAYDGLYFNTGSNAQNTRVFIHQNGSVGIGTTTPNDRLHVNGTARVGNGDWGALIVDGAGQNDWLLNAHNGGNTFAIRTHRDGETF